MYKKPNQLLVFCRLRTYAFISTSCTVSVVVSASHEAARAVQLRNFVSRAIPPWIKRVGLYDGECFFGSVKHRHQGTEKLQHRKIVSQGCFASLLPVSSHGSWTQLWLSPLKRQYPCHTATHTSSHGSAAPSRSLQL